MAFPKEIVNNVFISMLDYCEKNKQAWITIDCICSNITTVQFVVKSCHYSLRRQKG